MDITDYHAKYYAHELTKRCPSDSLEKLDKWAEDVKSSIEIKLKELSKEIKLKKLKQEKFLNLKKK